jgi:hypothetical protein
MAREKCTAYHSLTFERREESAEGSPLVAVDLKTPLGFGVYIGMENGRREFL